MIEIDREALGDFERAGRLEWLETDGLGGWAGSTLSGAHSRRDHHLLRLPAGPAATAPETPADPANPANLQTPQNTEAGGTVALAKLDELVIVAGHAHELSCNRFPFFVAAAGLRHLAGFRRDLFPVFEHAAAGVRLQKTVALIDGESTLVVLYEVLAAPGPFLLAIRPFFSRREAHALCRADRHGATPEASREAAGLRLRWPSGAAMLLAAEAAVDRRPDWWYRFELEEERRHGRDFQEDLWTPGLLRRELAAGERFGLVATAVGTAAMTPATAAAREPFELLARERRRREKLLDRLPVQDELTRILGLAAGQFSLRGPGARLPAAGYPRLPAAGYPRLPAAGYPRLLAAGYPDGAAAAADSLIALPGLLLATGRADEAKKLLRAHARTAAGGATASDAGAPGDALWLFVAAWRYLQATGDEDLVRGSLVPSLARIAAAHERGTASGLGAGADGLLEAAPGSPAAARRAGKAVEINALWHNALATLAELSRRLGDDAQAKTWGARAKRVQRRYAELFWNAAAGCLYDSAPAGAAGGSASAGSSAGAAGATAEDGRDQALRAHQVLAIGLPFPALSKQRAQRLLRTIEERLLTPVGLRDVALSVEAAAPVADSLDRGAEAPPGWWPGRAAGTGPDLRRHAPTHLAWPWLLGPFFAALVWLRGAAGRRQALQMVAELDPLLAGAAVGTIGERVGAEPPHAAVGHVAHAASVGELLRVYVDDLHGAATRPPPARRPMPEPRPKPKAKLKPKAKPEPGGGPKPGPRRARRPARRPPHHAPNHENTAPRQDAPV